MPIPKGAGAPGNTNFTPTDPSLYSSTTGKDENPEDDFSVVSGSKVN